MARAHRSAVISEQSARLLAAPADAVMRVRMFAMRAVVVAMDVQVFVEFEPRDKDYDAGKCRRGDDQRGG
jgi:hypothetical protein